MTSLHRRLLASFDAAAELTGLPALDRRFQGGSVRRHWRWMPLVLALVATVAPVLVLARRDLMDMAWAISAIALPLSAFFPALGPVKPWGGIEHLDEYDRAVRRRAYLFAYALILVATIAGMLALAVVALTNDWSVREMSRTLLLFALYLMTLYATLPTLHASWATRPIED